MRQIQIACDNCATVISDFQVLTGIEHVENPYGYRLQIDGQRYELCSLKCLKEVSLRA